MFNIFSKELYQKYTFIHKCRMRYSLHTLCLCFSSSSKSLAFCSLCFLSPCNVLSKFSCYKTKSLCISFSKLSQWKLQSADEFDELPRLQKKPLWHMFYPGGRGRGAGETIQKGQTLA